MSDTIAGSARAKRKLKPRAKWGFRGVYRIPEFQLSLSDHACLPDHTGFVSDIEKLIAEFATTSRMKNEAPTLVHVKLALIEVGSEVRALRERLGFKVGLDYLTRLEIHTTLLKSHTDPRLVNDCYALLWKLENAIDDTRTRLEAKKLKKGRKQGSNQQFAIDLFNLFVSHGLKPTTTRDGAYHKCLEICIKAAGYKAEHDNVHRLALAAAKQVKQTHQKKG